MSLDVRSIDALLPDELKECVDQYQTHKLASLTHDVADPTFQKVAELLGRKLAERRLRWRAVGRGYKAYSSLKG